MLKLIISVLVLGILVGVLLYHFRPDGDTLDFTVRVEAPSQALILLHIDRPWHPTAPDSVLHQEPGAWERGMSDSSEKWPLFHLSTCAIGRAFAGEVCQSAHRFRRPIGAPSFMSDG